MVQKSSEKYWEKRRELEDKTRFEMENKTINSLTSNLDNALKRIQSELLSQADLHNMTQSELLEDYSLRDQEKYRKHIDKNYKKLMDSDEKYQEFIDEYFPSYDYAKVNRLLQMRSDIFNILADETIKNDSNKKFNDGLEDIVNRMYNSNSNALMHILGPGDYNPLPVKDIENILNHPWSGKTFSNRLWGNISRLEQNLSNAMINSIASGKGVEDIIKTMRNDSEVSDMFKLEGKKFNKAIDNLVRTEYAHFAVEGLRKSVADAGINYVQSWSAEDERVCSVCGERHGKVIKDDWHPPYHGRCRCTEIPKIPELGEDIDKLYDEMFGDLLDEFAKDKFGIKLNKPNKSKDDRIDLGKSMLDAVGKKNFDDFHNVLNNLPSGPVKELFSKLGSEIQFEKIGDFKGDFAQGTRVNLTQEAFKGLGYTMPNEVVFHEIGHALDSLGKQKLYGKEQIKTGTTTKRKVLGKTKTFDEYVTHLSGHPDYNLKQTIRDDLWKHINGDLKSYDQLGKKPRKSSEKELWYEESSYIYQKNRENMTNFIKKMKSQNSITDLGALSDMLESTGWAGKDYPLGVGHGKSYWKKYGMVETEFFAHATEIVVNEGSNKIFQEVFPNALKVYEQIINDMLKGG